MNIENQILEKTAKLFKNYGIRSNTMDDIAREVGVSKKTLYQYINDKKQLVERVINSEYRQVEQQLNIIKQESSNPIDGLIRLNFLLIDFLQEINPATVNDLKKNYNPVFNNLRDKFQLLFKSYLLDNIAKGKKAGIYRSDLNDEVISSLHAERIQQMTESKKIWDIQRSNIESIKELINYYIRGIVNEKGEELLKKHLNDFNKYLNK